MEANQYAKLPSISIKSIYLRQHCVTAIFTVIFPFLSSILSLTNSCQGLLKDNGQQLF